MNPSTDPVTRYWPSGENRAHSTCDFWPKCFKWNNETDAFLSTGLKTIPMLIFWELGPSRVIASLYYGVWKGVSVPRHKEMLDIFSPTSLTLSFTIETNLIFFLMTLVFPKKNKKKQTYFSKELRTNNPVNSNSKFLSESATVNMIFTLT